MTTKKTADERKELLASLVHNQVAQGARVESQSDYQAFLVKGKGPRHVLHLILTILTGLLWLPVWIVLAICCRPKRMVATVDAYGNAAVARI